MLPSDSSPNPAAGSNAISAAVSMQGVSRRSSLVTLLLLWALIYLAGMFTPALLDDADSVHAEAAREMVASHDWVTLHVNRIRYLEKAPLLYWSIASSYELFGVSDWSSRLPLMLGVLAMILATWRLGARAYGERGGLYAGIALGTSIGPYLFTRFLIPDTLVGLWLTLTFLFFLRSLDEERPSRLSCWGIAVASALNVLTKGLIGLVFPVAVIGLYLIATGNLRHLLRMRLASSTLIFLVVSAPWHVLAALRNPSQGAVRGFLWFYFINEHVLRYLNKRVPRDYDTVPLAIFWGLLLLWVLPWGVFLPQSLREVPARWRRLRGSRDASDRAGLLFTLWALVILVFFSFSTRQEYYTIPALPALALLVGGWLAREARSQPGSRERRWGMASALALLVIGVAVFAAGFFLWTQAKPPAPGVELADLLKKNPDEYALSFGHFFDLTPQALGAFRGPLLGFSLAFLLGTGFSVLLRWRNRPHESNLALAAMMVALLTSVHAAFVTFNPILSSQKLAVALKRAYQPGDLVVVAGEYEDASTLNFYTGIPLRVLHEPSGNMWYGTKFPDAPRVFETQESFNALWAGNERIFLWTEEDHPAQLQGAKAYEIAHSGGKSLLSNRE